jgi:hypothetical protein
MFGMHCSRTEYRIHAGQELFQLLIPGMERKRGEAMSSSHSTTMVVSLQHAYVYHVELVNTNFQ